MEFRMRQQNQEKIFIGYCLLLFSVLLCGINYAIYSYFSLDNYIIATSEYRTNCHNNNNNKIHLECSDITTLCNTYYLIEQQERDICREEIKITITKYLNKANAANLVHLIESCDNLKNTYLESCLKNYDDNSINKFYIELKKIIPVISIGIILIGSITTFGCIM